VVQTLILVDSHSGINLFAQESSVDGQLWSSIDKPRQVNGGEVAPIERSIGGVVVRQELLLPNIHYGPLTLHRLLGQMIVLVCQELWFRIWSSESLLPNQ
jgi:DNA-binding transcriptional regulator YdaS (Cro superfamily)